VPPTEAFARLITIARPSKRAERLQHNQSRGITHHEEHDTMQVREFPHEQQQVARQNMQCFGARNLLELFTEFNINTARSEIACWSPQQPYTVTNGC